MTAGELTGALRLTIFRFAVGAGVRCAFLGVRVVIGGLFGHRFVRTSGPLDGVAQLV
jgi:hypothetical protein